MAEIQTTLENLGAAMGVTPQPAPVQPAKPRLDAKGRPGLSHLFIVTAGLWGRFAPSGRDRQTLPESGGPPQHPRTC